MKDKLLLATLISNLFYSMAYPVIHITVVAGLDSRVLSISSLISCILAIFINKMWLKSSEKLYNKFGVMLFLEGFVYFILLNTILANGITPHIYYVADAILFATITRNIICASNRLKAIRYTGKDREVFDNKSVIYYNMASIIGFGISSIFKIPVNMAFIIMYIGIISDNFIYYFVYKNTADRY